MDHLVECQKLLDEISNDPSRPNFRKLWQWACSYSPQEAENPAHTIVYNRLLSMFVDEGQQVDRRWFGVVLLSMNSTPNLSRLLKSIHLGILLLRSKSEEVKLLAGRLIQQAGCLCENAVQCSNTYTLMDHFPQQNHEAIRDIAEQFPFNQKNDWIVVFEDFLDQCDENHSVRPVIDEIAWAIETQINGPSSMNLEGFILLVLKEQSLTIVSRTDSSHFPHFTDIPLEHIELSFVRRTKTQGVSANLADNTDEIVLHLKSGIPWTHYCNCEEQSASKMCFTMREGDTSAKNFSNAIISRRDMKIMGKEKKKQTASVIESTYESTPDSRCTRPRIIPSTDYVNDIRPIQRQTSEPHRKDSNRKSQIIAFTPAGPKNQGHLPSPVKVDTVDVEPVAIHSSDIAFLTSHTFETEDIVERTGSQLSARVDALGSPYPRKTRLPMAPILAKTRHSVGSTSTAACTPVRSTGTTICDPTASNGTTKNLTALNITAQAPSSRRSSMSSSSSTTFEGTVACQDDVGTDKELWNQSLKTHQQSYAEALIMVSKRLIAQITGKEHVTEQLISEYEANGLKRIEEIEREHGKEFDRSMHQINMASDETLEAIGTLSEVSGEVREAEREVTKFLSNDMEEMLANGEEHIRVIDELMALWAE